MSNSALISYTKISPNSTNPRKNTIKKITIHHVAGNATIENLGELFANPARQASANYGIGSDGRIGLYVDEANRAWTSGSPENDNQAITIEVSNDGGAPDWHVSDKALESLVNLCVDICQRNNIKSLNYTGDTTGNLTRHNMFQATTCPGAYLQSKFPYIAEEVNRRLNGNITPVPNGIIYRVRKTWADAKSQIGAYKKFENAKKACKEGYSVFDNDGNVVYTNLPKAIPTKPNSRYNKNVHEWQNACILDGFTFPRAGADGIWGSECRSVAGKSVMTKALVKRKYNRVSWLQKMLGSFYKGKVDGLFGSLTHQAVVNFQKSKGILVDGKAGSQTIEYLI